MAFAVVQDNQGSSGAGATTTSVTSGAAITPGNLLIAAFLYNRSNVSQDVGTVVVNDNLGNGYVPGPAVFLAGSVFIGMRVFYAYNKVAGTPTTTAATFSSAVATPTQSARLLVHEVSGFTSGPQFDKGAAAGQTNPGTGANAISSGSVTTTANGEYIFAVTGTSANLAAISAGTGYTIRFNAGASTIGTFAEDQTQAAAGAISGTFTSTGGGANSFVTAIATFKDLAVTTNNRISQEAVEVLELGTGGANRVSQVAVEVADTFTGLTGNRVSQVAIEVLRATIPSGARPFGTIVW